MVGTGDTDATAQINAARARILDASETLFREHGFARTSMDAIAAAARVSKRTLYAEFADKRALLEAVLDRFIAGRFEIIVGRSQHWQDDRAMLIAMAQGLADAALAEKASAMFRLLIGEANHLPALAARAHRHGMARALDMMCDPLKRLGVADPGTAGRLIYDLVVLAPGHRALLGVQDGDMPAEQIVDIILAGVADR